MNGKIFAFTFFFFSLIFMPTFLASVHALTDDFNDGNAEGWKVIGGKWKVEKGEYVGTADVDEQVSYIGDASWKDYTVQVRMKADTDTPHFGMVFRESGKTQHYAFCLGDFKPGGWWYGYYDALGGPWVLDVWQDSGGAVKSTKEWNTLKVVVKDYTYEYYINDTLLDTYKDAQKLADSGYVGVMIGRAGCTVRFDDFSVEGPGIPGEAVEPSGKLTTTWAFIKDSF